MLGLAVTIPLSVIARSDSDEAISDLRSDLNGEEAKDRR
jgi:hypothetical protein